MTTTTREPVAARMESYSAEDRAFYRFWYGHIKNDRMQQQLCHVDHATARYIWDAALAREGKTQ